MTMWMGDIGHMVPTPCASDPLGIDTENRAVYGGGAGTLAPRRVLHLTGPGGRTWEVSVPAASPWEAAPVTSLARRQARRGGPLRVLPCEAPLWNMLTPGASEELAGWSGSLTEADPVTGRETIGRFAMVPVPETGIDSGSGVSAETVIHGPGLARGTLAEQYDTYPATVLDGQGLLTSPEVPVPQQRAGQSVLAGMFLACASPVTVTVQHRTGSDFGTWQTLASVSVTPGSGLLARHLVSAATTGSSAALRLRVLAASGVTYQVAWPSIVLDGTARRWVTGRGCDTAHLTPPSRQVTSTHPAIARESVSYSIIEVGA